MPCVIADKIAMKIFICASKHSYHKIPEIVPTLEKAGHILTMPNSYDKPFMEEEMKKLSREEHVAWKQEMLKKDEKNIEPQDAIFVLNLEKKGVPNYIGGATFLEIHTAFRLGKKVFLYNAIPDCIFTDELQGMNPTVLEGDLTKIV